LGALPGKLVALMNLGGECRLLLVGIESGRINGFEVIRQAHADERPLRRGDTL
jgi:hypothetical protein